MSTGNSTTDGVEAMESNFWENPLRCFPKISGNKIIRLFSRLWNTNNSGTTPVGGSWVHLLVATFLYRCHKTSGSCSLQLSPVPLHNSLTECLRCCIFNALVQHFQATSQLCQPHRILSQHYRQLCQRRLAGRYLTAFSAQIGHIVPGLPRKLIL